MLACMADLEKRTNTRQDAIGEQKSQKWRFCSPVEPYIARGRAEKANKRAKNGSFVRLTSRKLPEGRQKKRTNEAEKAVLFAC